jgi:ABC-2 type transport system permease protein
MTQAHKPLFSRPSLFQKPGTASWLIRNNIRTRLRAKSNSSRLQAIGRNIVLLILLGYAIFELGGRIARALAALDGDYNYPPYLLQAGIMLSAFAISLLGSSLISAYSVFTDRDDLDLLLASPLPPERILTARLLQSAYGACLTTTLIGTIAFGYSIVTVDVRFALIFPVLMSLMLINLAVSFVIARCLLLWFGLRRGRTVAMVAGFAVLIGGVLVFQINSMISSSGGKAILAETFGPGFEPALIALLTPIGRLAFGQIVETLMLSGVAVAAFIGVGAFFWDRFAADAALMAGQAQHVESGKKSSKVTFRHGILMATIIKEWRSMMRDPFVMVQVATPLVSLIPMAIALWSLNQPSATLPGQGLPEDTISVIIGFLVVMFGGQVAGTLAWTAASIEEAGDLLLSSPADGGKLFWSKALATAIPSFIFLALSMMIIGFSNPKAAFLGLGVGSVGLACVGAVEFLRPRLARRAKMTQRPDRSIISIILGTSFSLLWATATALVIGGLGLWTLIPISIGIAALVFVWASSPKSVVWMARAPKVGAAGGPWRASAGYE